MDARDSAVSTSCSCLSLTELKVSRLTINVPHLPNLVYRRNSYSHDVKGTVRYVVVTEGNRTMDSTYSCFRLSAVVCMCRNLKLPPNPFSGVKLRRITWKRR